MTFIQSTLSFGNYAFPYGMRIQDRQADQRIDDTPIPMTPGVNAPPGVSDKALIHVTGIIGGSGSVDSSGNYITTLDQCEAEVQVMLSYLNSGYQPLRVGNGDTRYCTAQKNKCKVAYSEAENRVIAHVDIEFLVEDPRWVSSTTHSVSASNLSSAYSNAGTTISWPTFTFTGAYANPAIRIYPGSGTASGGYILVVASLTMGSGDTLILDCNPRNRQTAVLLNGNPRLDLLGTTGIVNTVGDSAFFPYMLPGSNYTLANGSVNGTSVNMIWKDAYCL